MYPYITPRTHLTSVHSPIATLHCGGLLSPPLCRAFPPHPVSADPRPAGWSDSDQEFPGDRQVPGGGASGVGLSLTGFFSGEGEVSGCWHVLPSLYTQVLQECDDKVLLPVLVICVTYTIGNMTYTIGNMTCTIGNMTYTIGNTMYILGNMTCTIGNMTCTIGNVTYTIGNMTYTIENMTYTTGNMTYYRKHDMNYRTHEIKGPSSIQLKKKPKVSITTC